LCHVQKQIDFQNNPAYFPILAQGSSACFTDEGGKLFCYSQFGTGDWNTGVDTCAALGGHLPVVLLASKQNYLFR
jgi:hypothetical protein